MNEFTSDKGYIGPCMYMWETFLYNWYQPNY